MINKLSKPWEYFETDIITHKKKNQEHFLIYSITTPVIAAIRVHPQQLQQKEGL